MGLSIQQSLHSATQQLSNSDSPSLDAELLLCHVLDCDRSYLFTWPEKTLTSEQQQDFAQLIKRRAQGEPIAHLTGKRAFWKFDLQVNQHTLIPRPETELLVEQALALIPENTSLNILDLGTGSGAIALAIAHERPLCQVTAVEASATALQVAQANQAQLGVNNLELVAGSWFTPLNEQRFDIIVSNPPYIAEQDPHLNQGDVVHEPRSALVAGDQGLDDLEHIIGQASQYMKPQAWLLLEHGYDQAATLRNLFKYNNFFNINSFRDLAGHERVTAGQWRKQ